MGKFDFNVPPDFIKLLGNMQDVERIAPKMLDAAAPILERNVRSEAMKHKRTGDMANSIKRKKAARTKSGGYFVSVRPTGLSTRQMGPDGKIRDRKEPVRNMEILAYLEYGASNMSPTPILTKATSDSEMPVLDKMQETFNQEVEA